MLKRTPPLHHLSQVSSWWIRSMTPIAHPTDSMQYADTCSLVEEHSVLILIPRSDEYVSSQQSKSAIPKYGESRIRQLEAVFD